MGFVQTKSRLWYYTIVNCTLFFLNLIEAIIHVGCIKSDTSH